MNASSISLGAALYQEIDNKERVIRFASCALSKSESSYTAHKHEFLALKWSVTTPFHEYLYSNMFTVKSNNNPLTYVLTTAQLDTTGHWWVALLAA